MIRAGTRNSRLAHWQTNHVLNGLKRQDASLVVKSIAFETKGDRLLDTPLPAIGGKGLFTAELERGLLEKRIDIAVHSLKDLPTEHESGLTIGAILSRADVRDALVSQDGISLHNLPAGAVVGTSSNRRAAQVRRMNPGLEIQPIRGNVETRVRKVREGDFSATVLAVAGLARLDMIDDISQYFSFDQILPAPGQGALAVQCRADDERTLLALRALDEANVRAAVTSERSFLARLEAGCSSPVGAFATVSDGVVHLRGLVAALDGSRVVEVKASGSDAESLGNTLAEQALELGAAELMSSE